jgi:hypothetical protein
MDSITEDVNFIYGVFLLDYLIILQNFHTTT